MKPLSCLLILIFLVGCGVPTAVPVLTITPTINPTTTVLPHVTTESTPGPVVWDICPAAEKTYIGQVLAVEAVDMHDPGHGWAVDVKGRLLHSHDGGITWQNVTPLAGQFHPAGFFALNALMAWSAPDESCLCTGQSCLPSLTHGIIWRTSDGGKTWQQSQPFSLTMEGQNGGSQVPYFKPVSLQFVDDQTGWLLAEVNHQAQDRWMELFSTSDSGVTWKRISDHHSGLAQAAIQSVAFLDDKNAWLAVRNDIDLPSVPSMTLATAKANPQQIATVLKTTDGGRTWTPQSLPMPQAMDKFFDFEPRGEIRCGIDWVQTRPPNQVGVKSICRFMTGHGEILFNDVFYSGDGGLTWRDWIETFSLDFVSPSLIWHMSSLEGTSHTLWKSTGGDDWTYVRKLEWLGVPNFVDDLHGWVVAIYAQEKALVYTSDGGKNWQFLHPVIGR